MSNITAYGNCVTALYACYLTAVRTRCNKYVEAMLTSFHAKPGQCLYLRHDTNH